MFKIL